MVGGAVGANEAASVQTENHVQVLDGHVVDDLVVGTLHERGVDVAEGHQATGGHPRAERHGMLFSDAHVKGAVRHFLHHEFQAAPGRHGGGHPYDPTVGLGQFNDAVPKHVLELGWLGFVVPAFEDFTRILVEEARRVPFRGASCLRGRVSGAFPGHHMKQLGAGDVFQIGEHLREVLHVVAIHGTEVPEVQRLEEVALLQDRALDGVLDFLGNGLGIGPKLADASQQFPHFVFHLVVGV